MDEADTKPQWWLSFADGNLPEGQQFLGVAIVRGSNIAEAAIAAHARGINPGGEVLGFGVPEEIDIPDKWTNCLLDRETAEALDAELANA